MGFNDLTTKKLELKLAKMPNLTNEQKAEINQQLELLKDEKLQGRILRELANPKSQIHQHPQDLKNETIFYNELSTIVKDEETGVMDTFRKSMKSPGDPKPSKPGGPKPSNPQYGL